MDEPSEHSRELDEGWNTSTTVILEPDFRLKPEQREILAADYGIQNGHPRRASSLVLLVGVARAFGLAKLEKKML